MWRKVSLVLLLACVLVSQAFCGWSWGKDLLNGSSENSLEVTVEEVVTPVPNPSSTEEQNCENQTSEPLKNSEELPEISNEEAEPYEVLAEDYETNLTKTGEVLAEVKESKSIAKDEKKSAKVDEAIAIIESLKESKIRLDENHETLSRIVETQEKTILDQERRMNGVNFGIGASVWYHYPLFFSPSLDMQLRVGHWITNIGISYDFAAMPGFDNLTFDPHRLGGRIGFMYEF